MEFVIEEESVIWKSGNGMCGVGVCMSVCVDDERCGWTVGRARPNQTK